MNTTRKWSNDWIAPCLPSEHAMEHRRWTTTTQQERGLARAKNVLATGSAPLTATQRAKAYENPPFGTDVQFIPISKGTTALPVLCVNGPCPHPLDLVHGIISRPHSVWPLMRTRRICIGGKLKLLFKTRMMDVGDPGRVTKWVGQPAQKKIDSLLSLLREGKGGRRGERARIIILFDVEPGSPDLSLVQLWPIIVIISPYSFAGWMVGLYCCCWCPVMHAERTLKPAGRRSSFVAPE